ncbi:MAG: DsbA family protein [Pseudomonadota bacterium]
MIRSLLPALAFFVAAAPALAFDIDAMTDAERQAFQDEVRSYLLANPQVLVEALTIYQEQNSDGALINANYDALVGDDHSWVGGNPEGDITIVEFLDYRCGFCRRAFPEVEQLVSTDGNIRIIVKELPVLGPQSELASRFAIATLQTEGPDAYKTVHDTLMTFRGQISERALARVADDNGFDVDTIIAAMDSPEVAQVIDENRSLAQALRVNGTPTFVIGGQMLRGFLPLEGMTEIVAQERG